MQVQVLDYGNDMESIHTFDDSAQGITDIKYSPNNKYIAVSTRDAWIDLYK